MPYVTGIEICRIELRSKWPEVRIELRARVARAEFQLLYVSYPQTTILASHVLALRFVSRRTARIRATLARWVSGSNEMDERCPSLHY